MGCYIKEGIEDDRIIFLDKLVKKIPSINMNYGFSNKQPIWGNDFNNALINSKMGLNLSRENQQNITLATELPQ